MDNTIFATPEHLVRRALDCGLAELEAPGLDSAAFTRDWMEAQRGGDPRDGARVLQSHFQPIEWRWPRLGEFGALFARLDGLPFMWANEHCLADPMRTERKILGHYLAQLEYLERDFANRLDQFDPRFPLPDRIVLGGVDDEDKAIAAFARKCFKRVVADDIRTWPPFYPGCRATISWYRKSQLDRRTDQHLYPRRKVG